MRSPAESLLRGTAIVALLAALAVALWQSLRGEEATQRTVAAQFSESPSALQRDSLAALARAGRSVSWRGEIASLIAMAEPVREPGSRWRIAAVGDAALAVRDSLGPVDSLASQGALTLEPTRGPVQIAQGSTVALAEPQARATPRRAIVFGRVGWEPRFVITALEEAGWQVDARLELGRDRQVRQGDVALSITRHDVVIVLDSASARREALALTRFSRTGGGVILAGEAARADAPALRAIAGARVIAEQEPETRSFVGHEPTHALPLFALGALRSDAVLIESRESTPAVVARRVEAGRLLQLGYAETWRWRMEGEGRSVEDHRAYWSHLAGLVARGDVQPVLSSTDAKSAAPLAATVHAIGFASAEAERSNNVFKFPLWLGPIILVGLLAEWALRRRRGVP